MHDLVSLGEVLLRLAVPSPGRIETVRQLDVQIGGAEANVAAACARLGRRSAWISALPANAWGERVRRELGSHGVECAHVRTIDGARMGLYFLEYGVAPRPIRVLYDRRDSAFARLAPADVDWEPVRRARLVHLSGVTAGLGGSAQALVRRALAEASAVSFDVNYRAALWTPAQARDFIDGILPALRYLFLGESEAASIFGCAGAPESILEAMARRAPKATVTLMRGENGSLTFEGGAVITPARRHVVQLVDPIGAGDAFVGGFLASMLGGETIQRAVDVGSAVAALKCSTWGDIALVSPRDVDEVLSGGPDVRR